MDFAECDRLAARVVFLLDTSSSVAFGDTNHLPRTFFAAIDALAHASHLLLARSTNHTLVSVVDMSDAAKEVIKLRPSNSLDRKHIRDVIFSLGFTSVTSLCPTHSFQVLYLFSILLSGGMTNLTGGLRVARQILIQDAAISSMHSKRSDFIVILSDGHSDENDQKASKLESDILHLVSLCLKVNYLRNGRVSSCL